VELRQLEYFVAVARHRHFGRAAEAVYVTQPALSQQVRRLEAELGLALLRRTNRGVELTPAGEDLLARAETILAEVAGARGAMDEHAGVVRGAVRVASTITAQSATGRKPLPIFTRPSNSDFAEFYGSWDNVAAPPIRQYFVFTHDATGAIETSVTVYPAQTVYTIVRPGGADAPALAGSIAALLANRTAPTQPNVVVDIADSSHPADVLADLVPRSSKAAPGP